MHPHALPVPTGHALPPSRMIELELGRPLDSQAPASGDARFEWAVALVRLHTEPLGLVRLRLQDLRAETLRLDAGPVAAALEATLGDAIRAHLQRDGLRPADVAVASLPWPEDVRCLAARRALIDSPPPVTAVVSIADRHDPLRSCLEGLARQSYPGPTVIVVDNTPEPGGAAAIVADVRDATGCDVRYLAEPIRGSSAARNRVLAASATEITAFVDADVRVDPHWLAELALPLALDDDVGCVAGLVLPDSLADPGQRLLFEWAAHDDGFAGRDHPSRPGRTRLAAAGRAMAFRTRPLQDLGGFDSALGREVAGRGGEAQAAMLDMIDAGYLLADAPRAVAWHPDPAEVTDAIRQLHSEAVGRAALAARTIGRHPRAALELMLAPNRSPLAALMSRRSSAAAADLPVRRRFAMYLAELRGHAWGAIAYAIAASCVARDAAPARQAAAKLRRGS